MITQEVNIGRHRVGDSQGVVFMAELGTFYNQRIEFAMEMADAAIDAGSDIVKTEILLSADIVLNEPGLNTTYNVHGGQRTESYRELITRKIVKPEEYRKLFRHIQSRNVPFVASVYDFKGVDILREEGGAAIKLWRNNYNNVALVRYAAQTGLPLIFDFVNLYPHQMMTAVHTALSNGASGVVANYHPGKNPARADQHNLRLINTYKQMLGVPAGLSCHYEGDEMMFAAIGAGVNLIEKGIFDNPHAAEQNVITATALSDLGETIRKVRNCSAALGSASVRVEEPQDRNLLYGLVLQKDLQAGEVLDATNLALAFPVKGISAEHYDLAINARIRKNMKAGEPVSWHDLEFQS